MNEAIKNFIRIEFPYLQLFSEYINFIHLEYTLKVVILCDRYNKQESIIEGLDFTVLRNVLNKFNTRNLLNFLSQESNAFLFVHYFEAEGRNNAENQSDVEVDKLFKELQALYDEADKYVEIQLKEFIEQKKNAQEHLDFMMEDDELSLFKHSIE